MHAEVLAGPKSVGRHMIDIFSLFGLRLQQLPTPYMTAKTFDRCFIDLKNSVQTLNLFSWSFDSPVDTAYSQVLVKH